MAMLGNSHASSAGKIMAVFNIFRQKNAKEFSKHRSATSFALANKKVRRPFTDQATSQRSHGQSSGEVREDSGDGHQSYQHLSCICNMPTPQLWLEIMFCLFLITSLLLSIRSVIQAEAR